jgi:hypothetical protein
LVAPLALAAMGFLFGGGACANSDYGVVNPPVVLSMTANLAPIGEGEDATFQVQAPVPLPMRRGTPEEKKDLGPMAPYPRTPFLKSQDVRINARYTITNIDDKEHIVELLVDPWNEFVRYDPGRPAVTEEGVVVNLSGVDRFVKVPPKGRVVGNITPDDFAELAKDLGTVQALAKLPPPAVGNENDPTAGPALYNRAFNTQNRQGETDPLLKNFVPGVAAGITGFDLGMRTRAAANVSIEIVYEVTELSPDPRVIRQDNPETAMGRPGTAITPPALPAAP